MYALRTGTVRAIGAPIPCFLILTDAGDAVLVDSGPPVVDGSDPGPAALTAGFAAEPGEMVTAQLGRLGVGPADVRYLVSTHLDPDHAGHHHRFPAATLVVQAEHYAVARSDRVPRLAAIRSRWDRPELAVRTVAGDAELVPGIELVESSGHVPGHQSVLVWLAVTGPVLLAGDAVPMTGCLDPVRRPITPFDLDKAAVRASTAKLAAVAAAEGALVVCGHDPVQWRTLRTGPAAPWT